MRHSPTSFAGCLRRIAPAAALALAIACTMGCRPHLPGAAPSPISKNPFVATTYYSPAAKVSKLLVIAPSTSKFESKVDLSTAHAARLAEINTFTEGFVKALPAAMSGILLPAARSADAAQALERLGSVSTPTYTRRRWSEGSMSSGSRTEMTKRLSGHSRRIGSICSGA